MSNGLSWTAEQLNKHPKRDQLLGVTYTTTPNLSTVNCKNVEVVTKPVEKPMEAPTQKTPPEIKFTVPGPPMGKPRMTQRDRWMKRPAVLRYREYCDRIRAAAGEIAQDPIAIEVNAFIAMPESWSKKKKSEMNGKPHRAKPDYDNICKSAGDALFKEDSCLAGGSGWKTWCKPGEERTEITVLYL